MAISWPALLVLLGATGERSAPVIFVERPFADAAMAELQRQTGRYLQAESAVVTVLAAERLTDEPRAVASLAPARAASIVAWLAVVDDVVWVWCAEAEGPDQRGRPVAPVEASAAADTGRLVATLVRVLSAELGSTEVLPPSGDEKVATETSPLPPEPPRWRVGVAGQVGSTLPEASQSYGGALVGTLDLEPWQLLVAGGGSRTAPRTQQQVRLRSAELALQLAGGLRFDQPIPWGIVVGLQVAQAQLEARVLPFGVWEGRGFTRLDLVTAVGSELEVGAWRLRGELTGEAALRRARWRQAGSTGVLGPWAVLGLRLTLLVAPSVFF